MKLKTRHHIDMLNGPLFKDLVICSIPLLAQGILSLLFSTADCMVVGYFSGDDAVAAVGATSSLSTLLVNVFYGISIGTNVLTARYIGAREFDKVEKVINTSMALSIFGGVILIVLGFFTSKPLLVLMDTPLDVLEDATLYMKVYFLAMPFIMIYDFGASILRSLGDTKRPVYFLTVAGVANVVFDVIFVILLDSDVIAVALGTVVSQGIAAFLMWLSLTRDIGDFRVVLKNVRLDFKTFLDLLRFGIPTGVQSSLFSLSNMAIQSTVNSFGTAVVAGNTHAGNIESFVACPSNAVYSACMSFIAINLGAKNFKRVRKTFDISIVLSLVTSGVLGVLCYLLGRPLLGIFTDNQEVIAAGLVRLSRYSAFYFVCCFMDISSGALRGMGYSVFPMCISLAGACGFRILWIETVVKAYPTLSNLYWCFPISWALVSIAFIVCYKILLRKMEKKEANA